ncbi:MAG TPA: response regulator [Stellaceae bacterium]
MTTAGDSKVLVVDDDEANRYYKAHVLAKRGYRVLEAGRGADALRIVEAERPALVLLDVRLPDGSGIEVCGEIKRRQPGTFVLQTSAAFTRGKDRAAGLVGGADSYLVEPIEPDELLATVDSLVRLHRAEQALRVLNDALEQRVAERTRDLVEANTRLAAESENRVKIEAALHHVQKLDAIGQLTGGVAHDFNNLLTVVLGNLEMVEQELSKAGTLSRQKLSRFSAAARSAAEGCERLTRQLLAFGRRDVLRMEVLSPDEVINRFEALLRRALGEPIKLALALTAGSAFCRVDAGQLEAALLNLAVNARDAMPSGGEARLTTRAVDLASPDEIRAARVHLAAEAKPGKYICLSFSDTGSGMSQDVLQRAFEPFFTTKDVGQGSGLGLSQVYGFIRQSGGILTVETEIDAGTTFSLYLPRVEPRAELSPHGPDSEAAVGGRETILIVEDNALVLDFAVSTVTDLGYQVLLADDARAALDILGGSGPVDLLFTDIVLPNRMNGIELAREARRLRPGLKVLMTSGYSGGAEGAEGTQREFPFLVKPYGHRDLAKRIREVLTEA